MTLTQMFINQILLSLDKKQTNLIKNANNKFLNWDSDHINEQKQKNLILKTIDKSLNNNYKLLFNDLDNLSSKNASFNSFFKLIRLSTDVEFSLFWDHLQLVDNLNNDLTQQNFYKLKSFLDSFGSLKIQDQTLDDFWNEAISCENSDILAKAIFSLSLYSLLSHLDILTHHSLFNDIEPICLGWFFQKKLNPKTFQWKDGKISKVSNHKAMWTNPSRSLMTLMATFAAFKLQDEKPSTSHGLNFSNYLLNYTDKKENFIKKANEGFPISYTDFQWLLSERVDRYDIKDITTTRETIDILLNKENKYKSSNPIILLWIIYIFFQNDSDSQPKNTAYMHGFYYDFWELFSNFYKNKRSKMLPNQWPIDLQKSAQPLSD